MNTFVKGENEMWKMSAKKRFQTRIVAASAVKRVLDFRHQLSVCPATHLKLFRQKRNTHSLLRSNHPYYRNVAKHLRRETQIIKFKNAFHIWINIGYICERIFSAMPRVKSHFRVHLTDSNLQSQILCAVTPFRAEFRKIDQIPTASGVLLMVSRII